MLSGVWKDITQTKCYPLQPICPGRLTTKNPAARGCPEHILGHLHAATALACGCKCTSYGQSILSVCRYSCTCFLFHGLLWPFGSSLEGNASFPTLYGAGDHPHHNPPKVCCYAGACLPPVARFLQLGLHETMVRICSSRSAADVIQQGDEL